MTLPAKKEYPTAPENHRFSANNTGINTSKLHRRKKEVINYRQLNNSTAFGCFTANIRKFDSGGRGIFQIAGQPYHNIYALHPDLREVAKYSQLYICDSGVATTERKRLPCYKTSDVILIYEVDGILRKINPYALGYIKLWDLERTQNLNKKKGVNALICSSQ